MRMRHNKNGFSLIEITVALGLVAVGLVAVSPLFRQGMQTERHYELATTAVSIAQKKMEALKSLSYDALSAEAETQVSGFPAYTVQVEIGSQSALLKSVDVTVRWNSAFGFAQSYRLSTLRANY